MGLIRRLKCGIGLHKGHIKTKKEIEDYHNIEIDRHCAFVCSECGNVIE